MIVMTSGKYKGQKLSDVPAGYLLFCLKNNTLPEHIRNHVIENLEYFKEKQWEGKALKDDDIMPFGKFKGKKMKDVPASYLLYIYRTIEPGTVKNYIRNNIDVLNK